MPKNKITTANHDKPFQNVWILASPHAGDNRQLRALGEALGCNYEIKVLSFKRWEMALRHMRGARLSGLDAASKHKLAAPYPDLIIMAGRGNEAVGLWLKRVANPNAKLVYVGQPWNALSAFDLVIATPQYQVPVHPHVLHIHLPLHSIDQEQLDRAAAEWRPKLTALPQPYVTVLVGGSSGPYVFSAETGRRLAVAANGLAEKYGGSLLISTSARTPKPAIDALSVGLTRPHYIHHYGEPDAGNPFLAFLALSNHIIVTADSISMIAEAVASGKSVSLFDIEIGKRAMQTPVTAESKALPPVHWSGSSLSATIFRLAMRWGPKQWTRDLRIVHQMTINSGLTHWLGEKTSPSTRPPPSDLTAAVARILTLRAHTIDHKKRHDQ